MSVQSEINRIKNNIAAAYTAIDGKLETPLASTFTKNSNNLVSAITTIASAPGNGLKIVYGNYTGNGNPYKNDNNTSSVYNPTERTLNIHDSSIKSIALVIFTGGKGGGYRYSSYTYTYYGYNYDVISIWVRGTKKMYNLCNSAIPSECGIRYSNNYDDELIVNLTGSRVSNSSNGNYGGDDSSSYFNWYGYNTNGTKYSYIIIGT